MNLLLTNDDGYDARGILALAERLKQHHRVVIVAPDGQRSAASHALTMGRALCLTRQTLPEHPDLECYSLNGSPADCVKLALKTLYPQGIDLVISGINNGANMGFDIFYSGTVAAGIEAVLMGTKAIAFSLQSEVSPDVPDFDQAAKIAADFLEQIALSDIKELWNVNLPALPAEKIKGVLPMPQGGAQFDERYDLRTDNTGQNGYWLAGGYIGCYADTEVDSAALAKGYIAVTPIRCKLTDEEELARLKCKFDRINMHF